MPFAAFAGRRSTGPLRCCSAKCQLACALLLLLAVLFQGGNCLAAKPDTAPPPTALDTRCNVLLIAVDDMNVDLGCYGSSLVKSPHIDSLAARGTRFDRAYCQYPLGSPSRTSMLTGLRPDTTTVSDQRKHFRSVLPDVVTLPQLFGSAGYFTARVGEIYFAGNPDQIGTPGLDDPASWNATVNPRGRDKAEQNKIINYTPKQNLSASLSALKAEGDDEQQTDGMVASETIRLLAQHKAEPFFIAAGFYRPHCPYVAPKKYFDLYALEQIQVPTNQNHVQNLPPPALSSARPWPWYGATEEQAREAKLAYYAAISFTDANVGRLLQALDRLELTDKTIVVFWSDQGHHLGEHGLWASQSLFENSARTPLIIARPSQAAPGVCRRTVEAVDIYPTLADLCGIAPPKNLAGRSLKPLLENPQATWDRPAFTQVQRGNSGARTFTGRSVRTERWRYTEWEEGRRGAELYDYDNDPAEEHNLADDPAAASVVGELRGLLRKNYPVAVNGL